MISEIINHRISGTALKQQKTITTYGKPKKRRWKFFLMR